MKRYFADRFPNVLLVVRFACLCRVAILCVVLPGGVWLDGRPGAAAPGLQFSKEPMVLIEDGNRSVLNVKYIISVCC